MKERELASIVRALDEAALGELAKAQAEFQGGIKVKLDVLSEHDAYADDDGVVVGLFVKTSQPAALGTAATLQLELPWGDQLVLSGAVEWVRELSAKSVRRRSGMGVRFVGLSPEQRRLLDRAMVLREPISIPADARR